MLESLHRLFRLHAHDDVYGHGLNAVMTDLLSAEKTHADIARVLLSADDVTLRKTDTLLKARVLHKLSDGIAQLESEARRVPAKLYKAGDKLVRQTPLPDMAGGQMRDFETEMVERVAELFPVDTFMFSNQAISQKEAVSFCRDFVDHFADVYGIERGIAFRPLAPENKGFCGQAYWDPAEGIAVVEADLDKNITQSEMIKLVVTLGHECVHAALNTMQYGTQSRWDEAWKTQPDAFIFHAVTDRRFYTSADRDKYENHPEEVFAERVGLRLGVLVAQHLGMTPNIAVMAKESLGVTPRPEILREMAALFQAPSRTRAAKAGLRQGL